MTSKYIRVMVVWVVTLAALYVFQAAFGPASSWGLGLES